MNWKFFINENEIDEPVGFADLSISIKRDDVWRGIFFEASTSELRFYGEAFDILHELKITRGLKAVAIFRATFQCDDDSDFEDAIAGKLNFGQYKETCGTECFITMPIEQDNCTMILRNRYDQKVNIDDPKSFDRVTDLAPYDKLNFVMSLPTIELPASIDANVAVGGYEINQPIVLGFVSATFAFRPLYFTIRDNSITTGNIDSGSDSAATPPNNAFGEAISPQLLFDNSAGCFSGSFDYEFRLKGFVQLNDAGLPTVGDTAKIRLMKGVWPNPVTAEIDSDILSWSHPSSEIWETTFDSTFTGSVTLADGEGIYMILQFETEGVSAGADGNIQVIFDPESSVLIQSTKACPPTDANVYAINETISRIVEAITDNCIKAKSIYYGRTDSEPFAMDDDGCGSLRIVTNGLKLRQADKNNDFFVSLKDMFDGLNAIDNIGIGIEDDPDNPGTDKKLLRIEDARYFFNNTEIMTCDFIPKAVKAIIEKNVIAKIMIGYDKYETESIKGTDEFNSEKEFRTSIDATDNTLDQVSKLIAGSYPIEITREQQFGESSEADTKYDNDTFIICLKRGAYELEVEQGNIEDAANIAATPGKMYNWRIRPMYNLMRWAKSIFQSYVDLSDDESKIFFSSGKGNYSASGQLPVDDPCKLENAAIAENHDLSIDDFADQADALPIIKAESITFDYPLSIADYKKIKSNPYGYILVQCGFGSFDKAFISQIDYKVAEGLATFNLIFAGAPGIPITDSSFGSEFSDEFG